jgi:hypothetical protein
MFCAGSLMSQVLQCTQFCALIWKRLPPLGSFDDLVDAGRAVALRGLVVERQVVRIGTSGILQCQVAGLVFLVVGVRQEHR